MQHNIHSHVHGSKDFCITLHNIAVTLKHNQRYNEQT